MAAVHARCGHDVTDLAQMAVLKVSFHNFPISFLKTGLYLD